MEPTLSEATEPFALLAAWYVDAEASEPRVPDAMQLATVGEDGRPSLRTVLLKEHGPQGLVFYTNLGSRKAREIAARPDVALLLHWKSLERQVIAEGRAVPVPDATADAYWASRPRGSQLGAWASRQSADLSPGELHVRLDELTRRFEGSEVPRPPFWSGFVVAPSRVEFWQGRPDRLHDRVVFERDGGAWRRRLLHP